MDTGNADSYIPSTIEYEVLRMYIPKLTYVITDPVRLAADMFVADLISDSTRIKANMKTSTKEAINYYILDELLTVVNIDPANFQKIIFVLQGHPPCVSAIAEKMMRDYGNKTIYI